MSLFPTRLGRKQTKEDEEAWEYYWQIEDEPEESDDKANKQLELPLEDKTTPNPKLSARGIGISLGMM